MKSTLTDNKIADTILKRIDIKRGTPHWGNVYLDRRSYSFECNNKTFITAIKHTRDGKKDEYSVEISTKSQIYDKYLKTTNNRGKKIYEAILELFKEHDKPPYTYWVA